MKHFILKFFSKSLILLYGILCFFFPVISFLVLGFYTSALIFIILILGYIILFPDNFWIMYILLGLFSASWGVGILDKNVDIKAKTFKKITAKEEIKIGLESSSNFFINILMSALVSCCIYAILSIIGIKNDVFKNVVLILIFFITFFLILYLQNTSSKTFENGKGNNLNTLE